MYPFFVAVLVSYTVGGWVAGREAPDGALSNGALVGVLGFAAWIPIRILIWLVRDEHKGLFTGHEPVLRPGQLFGHVLIASALGMLGGFLGAASSGGDRVPRRAEHAAKHAASYRAGASRPRSSRSRCSGENNCSTPMDLRKQVVGLAGRDPATGGTARP